MNGDENKELTVKYTILITDLTKQLIRPKMEKIYLIN